MSGHVYKKVEIVGSSPNSMQEAIENGVAKAAESLHNLRWFEVVDTRGQLEDGKVTPEKSDDIYELDKKFTKRIAIPDALGRYLTTEKYWNLRDMNISPDFKESMDQFFEHYSEVRGEPDNV